MRDKYGNPSSVHEFGRTVRRSLQTARQQVAELINANCPGEIYFTGSGTEADNLAIKGIVLNGEGKRHIITSAVEHHAILHTCEDLEENHGCRVTYLPVNGYGMVDPASVREAIADDTALVSIMYANNEVGTIQPIREIAAICREKGVLMHTDAVQGVGQLPIDVQADGVDMLTLSARKIYGPKSRCALCAERRKDPTDHPRRWPGAWSAFRHGGHSGHHGPGQGCGVGPVAAAGVWGTADKVA